MGMDSSELIKQILPLLLPQIEGLIQGVLIGGSVPSPHALNSPHHSGVLADNQAPQFLKTDGSRTLTGNLGVNAGVTIDGIDLSAMNAGTLSVSSANSAGLGGTHVHAITTSSNPGASASILATPASGVLTLRGLTVTLAPTFSAFTNVGGVLYTNATGQVQQDSLFIWQSGNKRLGVNRVPTGFNLEVGGSIYSTGGIRADIPVGATAFRTTLPTTDGTSISSTTRGFLFDHDGNTLFQGVAVEVRMANDYAENIQLYDGSTYTDLTDILGETAGQTATVNTQTTHHMYIGKLATFGVLFIGVTTLGVGYTNVLEYWNGSAWTALTPSSQTILDYGSATGTLTWTIPGDWVTTTIADATQRFYVRIRSTTNASTGAVLHLLNTSRVTGFPYRAYYRDIERFRVSPQGDLYAAGRVFPGSNNNNLDGATIQTTYYTYQVLTGIAFSHRVYVPTRVMIGTVATEPGTALHVVGGVAIDAATPTLYTAGAVSGEQGRYLQITNSVTTVSPAGLKAGGVVVADAFAYASPGKNDLTVKGAVTIANATALVSGYNLEVYGTGILAASAATNNTAKAGRFGTVHYTNAEEPVLGLIIVSDAAANTLRFGGGASFGNAATVFEVYLANNTITTSGTRVFTVTGATGLTAIGPTHTAVAQLDVLAGVTDNLRLRYDAATYATLNTTSVGTLEILTTAATPTNALLDLKPGGSIILTPSPSQTTGDVLPNANYRVNLGLLTRKYLTLHAAELWVETLVAQETIATIGGRVLVGPTTTLTRDITNSATTIFVKHNQMVSGDRVYMEANGKFEFMAVTSAPTTIDGTPPDTEYSYTVTRNLDGTGATAWYAGDALFNTGQATNGWIDLYSVRGMKYTTPGGVKTWSQFGPAIVMNVRNSSTFNDWTEHAAFGNLRGVYGYGSNTYGVAFGKYQTSPGSTYTTIDATNGYRIFNGTTVIGQWDQAGVLTLGATGGSIPNLTLDGTNGIRIRQGTTTVIGQWDLSGNITLGQVGAGIANAFLTSAGAVQLRVNTTPHIVLDGATATATFGEVGAGKGNFFVSSGNAYIRLNTVAKVALLTTGEILVGDTSAATNPRISIDTTNGVRVIQNSLTLGQWSMTGDMTLGQVATSKGNIFYDQSTGVLNFRNNTTVRMFMDASGFIQIGQTGAGQSNLYIDSDTFRLRRAMVNLVYMDSTGVLSIGDTSSSHVHISAGTLRIRTGAADYITLDPGGNLGLVGVLTLGTGGGIYQGTGTFASPTTGLKVWNDSGVGRIGGYNAGTVQWYAATDGKLYAGAGAVKLDAGGINITPSTSLESWRYYGFKDGATDFGGLTSYYAAANFHTIFLEAKRIASTNSFITIEVDGATGQSATIELMTRINGGGRTGITISKASAGTVLTTISADELRLNGPLSRDGGGVGWLIGGAVYYPLQVPLAHASYNNSAVAVGGWTQVNLSSFSPAIPSTAKAVHVHLVAQFATVGATTWIGVAGSSSATNYPVVIVRPETANFPGDSSGTVAVDPNGGTPCIWVKVNTNPASGVFLQIFGYYI